MSCFSVRFTPKMELWSRIIRTGRFAAPVQVRSGQSLKFSSSTKFANFRLSKILELKSLNLGILYKFQYFDTSAYLLTACGIYFYFFTKNSTCSSFADGTRRFKSGSLIGWFTVEMIHCDWSSPNYAAQRARGQIVWYKDRMFNKLGP